MRTLFPIFLVLISFPLANAQTIDASWFPRAGISYSNSMEFSDDFTEIELPTFGLDQEWDFSYFPRAIFFEEIAYVEPESTEYYNLYPEANLVKTKVDDYGKWFWYYNITADTIFEEGLVLVDEFFGFDTIFQVNPDPIPTMYDGFSLGDSLWTISNRETRWSFLGTGSISTRYEKYDDCVLFKEEVPNVGVGAVIYRWYHKNLAKEVFTYVPEESDHPSAVVTWIRSFEDVLSASVDKVQSLPLDARYNGNNLLINNTGATIKAQVFLYDLGGAILHKSQLTLLNGENTIMKQGLNTVSDGSYVLLIIDEKTTQFYSQKLIVNN